MNKPIFLTFPSVAVNAGKPGMRVVIDITDSTPDQDETGVVYVRYGADDIVSYTLNPGQMELFRQTGQINAFDSFGDYANYADIMRERDEVEMSEQSSLAYPKADILARIDSIVAFLHS